MAKKRVNIDADLRNADWIRTRTWDLPTDKDMFLAVIAPTPLEHFMTLPAAEAMPDKLRMELGLPHKDAVEPTTTEALHKPLPVKRLRVVDDGGS